MRFDLRTLKRTISALAVVLVLLLGTGADALAHGGGKHKNKNKNKGRQNQGRHLGWTRGRHVGWEHSRSRHVRDDDNWRWRRRQARRDRRDDRRDDRWDSRRRRSFSFDSRRDLRVQRSVERARFWRNDRRF